MGIGFWDWGLGLGVKIGIEDFELGFGIILVLIEMRIRNKTRQKIRTIYTKLLGYSLWLCSCWITETLDYSSIDKHLLF